MGKVSFGVAGLAELGNLGWSKDFEHVDGQENGKSDLRVAKYHRETWKPGKAEGIDKRNGTGLTTGERTLGLHGVAFKDNPRTLENKMDRANGKELWG